MTPTELLDDHARRPRSVGKLLNASAVGDVGSIVVGDALRFYIGVGPRDSVQQQGPDGLATQEPHILQAKFQVFNCSDQVAASSVLSELVIGKTLSQAKAVGHADLCSILGGLDVASLPPRLWAVSGLQAAIAAHEGTELEHDIEHDALLCRCYAITEQTIRQAVAVQGCATVEDVVKATGAGTGCGTCRVDLPILIDEVHHQPAAQSAASIPSSTTLGGRIHTMQRISKLLDSALSAQLQAQGGGLELWDFDGRMVKVRALGTLIGDAQARRTALSSLEQLLRTQIDPALGVADQGEGG